MKNNRKSRSYTEETVEGAILKRKEIIIQIDQLIDGLNNSDVDLYRHLLLFAS